MDAPILFLPLRIETRMTEGDGGRLILHVRAWPDQIHVDALRRSVSAEERRLLDDHDAQVAAGRRGATDRLSRQMGAGRARWLVEGGRHRDLPADGGHSDVPPVARGLPARLRFLVTARGIGTRSTLGAPIDEPLPVAPPLDDDSGLAFTGKAGDPVRWLTDFDHAVALGMAASVELPLDAGTQWDRITAVEVVGVPRGDAEADGARLQSLVEAHVGSGGVDLMRIGTPTKGPREPGGGSDRGGPGLERALGLAAGTFPSGDRAGIDGVQALCAELVWSAAIRPALIDGWLVHPDGRLAAPLSDLEPWRRRFVQEVRPAGRHPVIALGAQPYGVHVMRGPKARGRDPLAELAASAVDRFADHARDLHEARARLGPFEALIEVLARPATSVAMRSRRAHPLMATLNLALNASGSSARTLAEAAAVRAGRAELLGFWRPEDGRRAALYVLHDPHARVFDGPMVTAAGEDAAPGSGPRVGDLLKGPLRDLFIPPERDGSVLELLCRSALAQGVRELAAATGARDEDEVARILGRFTDYIEDPPDLRARFRARLHQEWREVGVADLVAELDRAAPPSRAPERRATEELVRLYKVVAALDDAAPALLARCFPAALDAASHRIDAWDEADAARALEALRTAGGRGVHLSAHARLEGSERMGSVAPVFRLAPSLSHAATGALLQQAADDARADGMPVVPIDLSAERTALALDLAHHLREGGDIAEALGAMALDALARAGHADLVPALAERFGLRDGVREGALPQSGGVPRLDGLGLLAAVRSGTLPPRRGGGLDETADVALHGGVLAIAPLLAEAIDAYHDLHMAEGIHLLANGRAEAAHGAFEAMAGGGLPPDRFEVTEIAPAAAAVSHMVALAVADPAPASNETGLDRIAPVAAKLAAALVGRPTGTVSIELLSGGRPESTTIRLADLPLTPFEWTMAARPGHRWIDALRPAARAALDAAGEGRAMGQVRPWLDAEDWLWLCERAGAALTQARPLTPADHGIRGTDGAPAGRAEAATALLDAIDAAIAGPSQPAALALFLAVHGRGGEAARLMEDAGSAADISAELREWSAAARRPPEGTDPLDAVFRGLPIAPVLPYVIPDGGVPAGHAPGAGAEWLGRMQRVRPRLGPLADALAAGADRRLRTTPVQRAEEGAPPDTWLALRQPPGLLEGTFDAALIVHPGDPPSATIAGFHIDGWREELPENTLELGLAVRREVPPGRAANVLLLCVPDEDGPDPDHLEEVTRHAFAQMQARTLTLADLPPAAPGRPARDAPFGDLGGFLPLLWLAHGPPWDDGE